MARKYTIRSKEEKLSIVKRHLAGETELALTLEGLGIYNGKDGNPSYITVDGTIYDVTSVSELSGGEHNGFSVGKDLTYEIKTSQEVTCSREAFLIYAL